jgi:hypothetical protein
VICINLEAWSHIVRPEGKDPVIPEYLATRLEASSPTRGYRARSISGSRGTVEALVGVVDKPGCANSCQVSGPRALAVSVN